jgi:hypothetical protein
MWWKVALTLVLFAALFGSVAAIYRHRPPLIVTILAYLSGLATAAVWII